MAGCGGGVSAEDKVVTVYLSGDTNIKAMWDGVIAPGFAKDNPGYSIKIVFSEHGVNDTTTQQKLAASQKTNDYAGADVFEAAFVNNAATSDLFAKTTSSDVPNLSKVATPALDAVKSEAVPYRGSSVVLAYDSSKVASPPKTLDELTAWIKANPGQFTYNTPNSGGSGMSFAETVVDRTLPADVLSKMQTSYDPALESNWDTGFKALHDLTPFMYQKTYPNGNSAVIDLLSKGQITMAPVWSDQALSAIAKGSFNANIKLAQITDPGFTGGLQYIGMPKNTKANKAKSVFKLENWMLDPSHQGAIVNAVKGYPAIKQELLPAETAALFKGLDTSALRPGYFAKVSNDFKQQWTTRVP